MFNTFQLPMNGFKTDREQLATVTQMLKPSMPSYSKLKRKHPNVNSQFCANIAYMHPARGRTDEPTDSATHLKCLFLDLSGSHLHCIFNCMACAVVGRTLSLCLGPVHNGWSVTSVFTLLCRVATQPIALKSRWLCARAHDHLICEVL
jgi:hypothetical protein